MSAGVPPFEAVVAEHGPRVLRVCRAVLGSGSGAAEDAWSETFLSAMRAYPELRPGSNVEGWLVTIAHRKAIDQLRAAGRRAIPTGELPEEVTVTVVESDSELLGALRALPFKQRAAVAYHHLGGLPYAEVAEIVGGSPEAARKAASDGIAALRRSYVRGGT